jgi:hypothetical protein
MSDCCNKKVLIAQQSIVTDPNWLNGSGVPSPSLGNDTNYYLNTDNGDVYQKVAGVWVLEMNLTGPAGTDGVDGAPGADGVDGVDGAPGTDGVDGADGAPGVVQSIVAGTNVTIGGTAANPIVNATGGTGVIENAWQATTIVNDVIMINSTGWTGTFGSVSGELRYVQVGKLLHIDFDFSFTLSNAGGTPNLNNGLKLNLSPAYAIVTGGSAIHELESVVQIITIDTTISSPHAYTPVTVSESAGTYVLLRNNLVPAITVGNNFTIKGVGQFVIRIS